MANSPLRSPIDVGAVIANTYQIEALIGRGGMGSVFLASHLRLPGKQVAIKLLHTDIDDPDVHARFRREAEIASRLGHPNIVAVHDFNITPEGMPYLVLEYLRGTTLATKIAEGPMSMPQTMSIIRQVGSALAAAHREGIVHRDLKPQNIFLVPTEIDDRVVEVAKVLDFGISKICGSSTVKTQESALLGTPQYMSPEQATGNHSGIDERTDVFALGAIVHEMLGGRPAFEGASIPEVVFKVVYEQPTSLPHTIPAQIVAAIKHAMEKSVTSRFATVSAFVEALTGTPLTQLRVALVEPPPGGGFAAGSKHENLADAHASTMASGNHASATQRAEMELGETSAPGSDQVAARTPPRTSAQAATVDSVVTQPSKDILEARTPAPPPVDALPAPPARALWPVLLVIGGAIAATVIVMLFVLGRAGDQASSTRQPVGTKDKPDKHPTHDAAPRAPADVSPTRPIAVEEHSARTPQMADPKPHEEDRRATAVAPKVAASDDPELAQALADAETAYDNKETELGNNLVNQVVNGAKGKLLARALLLRGTHRCEGFDEKARIDIRMLETMKSRSAATLKRRCHGFLE